MAARFRPQLEEILATTDEDRVNAAGYLVATLRETFGMQSDEALYCLTGADPSLGVDAIVMSLVSPTKLHVVGFQCNYAPAVQRSAQSFPREMGAVGKRTLDDIISIFSPLPAWNERLLRRAEMIREILRRKVVAETSLFLVEYGSPQIKGVLMEGRHGGSS